MSSLGGSVKHGGVYKQDTPRRQQREWRVRVCSLGTPEMVVVLAVEVAVLQVVAQRERLWGGYRAKEEELRKHVEGVDRNTSRSLLRLIVRGRRATGAAE